jgi:hypothetical protein
MQAGSSDDDDERPSAVALSVNRFEQPASSETLAFTVLKSADSQLMLQALALRLGRQSGSMSS